MDGPDGLALVTAAHNTSGDREEYVEFQQAWGDAAPVGALLERVGDTETGHDVAVYGVPDDLRPTWYVGSLEVTDQGLVYGQDCFILGYPYLLAGDITPQGTQLPLIKKAVISGRLKRDWGDLWLVDTIANPGYSGSPLVFQVAGTREFRVAGVVIQAMTGPISEGGDPHAPAGFSLCLASRHVRDILEHT